MGQSLCTAVLSTLHLTVSLFFVIKYPSFIFFSFQVPRSQKVLAQNAQQPLAVDLEFDAMGEWQYAIDPETLQVDHLPDPSSLLPSPIFDSGQSPLSITVTACPISWMTAGSTFAASPPMNPSCIGTNTTLSLTPLGVSFFSFQRLSFRCF